jgi:hypothetical protein
MTQDTIATVARSISDMRVRVINDAIRSAVADGAEALDAWVVFEGTTARVFTKVTTLDAPPSGPDGCERFILNPPAAS